MPQRVERTEHIPVAAYAFTQLYFGGRVVSFRSGDAHILFDPVLVGGADVKRPSSLGIWMVLLAGDMMLSSMTGCSVKKEAINSVATMLSSGDSSMGQEDDPAFLAAAIPFGLMTMESLARSSEKHIGLRVALASGFAHYAYACSDLPGELLKFDDLDTSRAHQSNARKRYLRAVRWGLEGLEIGHPGFKALLETGAQNAADMVGGQHDDVALHYWTGAATMSPGLFARI